MHEVNIDMAIDVDEAVEHVNVPNALQREKLKMQLDTNILEYFRWMKGAVGAQTPREFIVDDGDHIELGDENDYDPNWEPDYRGPGGNRAWWTNSGTNQQMYEGTVVAPSHAYIALPYEVYPEEDGDQVYQ